MHENRVKMATASTYSTSYSWFQDAVVRVDFDVNKHDLAILFPYKTNGKFKPLPHLIWTAFDFLRLVTRNCCERFACIQISND